MNFHEAFFDELEKHAQVYYHGSPVKFSVLRKGSWVTPHKEDARKFGIPWSSKDLAVNDNVDGRPPRKLVFKPGRVPDDLPLYVYEVSAPVTRAKTNTGRSYDWNHQITEDAPARLVEKYRSWKLAKVVQ